MQILIGNPRAILSACFESLSYNSGELYDAAMDTIRSFLKEGMQRRNGDSRSHDWEENVMQKATMNHPKLAEWLPTAVSLQKGKQSLDLDGSHACRIVISLPRLVKLESGLHLPWILLHIMVLVHAQDVLECI